MKKHIYPHTYSGLRRVRVALRNYVAKIVSKVFLLDIGKHTSSRVMQSRIGVGVYNIIIPLTFALMLVYALPAYAQPEVIKSAHRQVIESVDKLSEVKELDLSPEEKAARELELKKIALDKVVTLSILETESIRTSLTNLELQEEGIEAELRILKDQFSNRLVDYIEHLNFIKNGIKASEDLDQVQNIAGSFNEWREFIYNGGIKEVLELLLFSQNQSLIDIADYRFSKIASDLKKITSPKLQSIIREQFLNPAALSIKEAREFNNRALALLSEYLPKKEVIETEENEEQTVVEIVLLVDAPNPILEIEEEPIIEKLTVRDLVINSLHKLKEAYSGFLGLRDLVISQVSTE